MVFYLPIYHSGPLQSYEVLWIHIIDAICGSAFIVTKKYQLSHSQRFDESQKIAKISIKKLLLDQFGSSFDTAEILGKHEHLKNQTFICFKNPNTFSTTKPTLNLSEISTPPSSLLFSILRTLTPKKREKKRVIAFLASKYVCATMVLLMCSRIYGP